MARSPFLLVAALLLVALAGCLGGGDEPEPTPGGDGDDSDAQPTETHGVVRGAIITADNFQPVVGADVRLIQEADLVMERKTNDKGEYVFRDVEPGGYRLQVSTICCKEQVSAVQVKAGEETKVSFQLERLEEVVVHTPYVDTDGEWTGLINCGVSTTETGVLYPAACQQGDHDVRNIVFFGPGVRTITMQLTWDAAATGLGAEEMRLTAHNLNAKFKVIGATEGTSPLTLQIQNYDVVPQPGDDEDHEVVFQDFDAAGWVARFAITPLSDSAAVLYQQSFNLQYHVHYWEAAPTTYTVADAANAGGEGASAPGGLLGPQAMNEPNEPQEGPNSDCADYNVIYLIDGHSPLAVTVEVEEGSGFVIDSSAGLAFVDFHDEDGEWLGWSERRHWGNVPTGATYALLCVGIQGGYPDVPEPFASWFYMDGFPPFEG